MVNRTTKIRLNGKEQTNINQTGEHQLKKQLLKKSSVLVIACIALLGLTGCGGATDGLKCLTSVQDAYPDSKVVQIEKYKFLVQTPDGQIRYIKTNAITSADITHDVKVGF